MITLSVFICVSVVASCATSFGTTIVQGGRNTSFTLEKTDTIGLFHFKGGAEGEIECELYSYAKDEIERRGYSAFLYDADAQNAGKKPDFYLVVRFFEGIEQDGAIPTYMFTSVGDTFLVEGRGRTNSENAAGVSYVLLSFSNGKERVFWQGTVKKYSENHKVRLMEEGRAMTRKAFRDFF